MKQLGTNQMQLGFIGLGNMGSRIAKRLLDHGYQLSVYDRDPAKTQVIATHGAAVAENIHELAHTADVVLSCLTNDEAVRSVYAEPDGIFAGARPGTVVLEMSTVLQKPHANCTSSVPEVASRYWMLLFRAALPPPSKAS